MKLDNVITIAVTALMVCTALILAVIKPSTVPDTITKNGKTLYLVKDFHYIEPGANTCLAASPECGYCPGEVVDKLCYAEKNY